MEAIDQHVNVIGIGEKRKKELIKRYKNIINIKNASIDELDKILPHDVSINLLEFLKNYWLSIVIYFF